MIHELVDGSDEALESRSQVVELTVAERGHDVLHQLLSVGRGVGMTFMSGRSGRHHDHSLVLGRIAAIGQAELLETLHGPGGRRGIDAQSVGQITHPPGRLLHQKIEGVHLADLESIVTDAEEIFDEPTHRCTAADLAPGAPDAHRHFALQRIIEIDDGNLGG